MATRCTKSFTSRRRTTADSSSSFFRPTQAPLPRSVGWATHPLWVRLRAPKVKNMEKENLQDLNGIGGASGKKALSAPQTLVDVYVYSAAFPSNFWNTLHELTELYEKRELNESDMLRLKLLAVLLTEQLLGQLSVDSPKVIGLMQEYDNLKGE